MTRRNLSISGLSRSACETFDQGLTRLGRGGLDNCIVPPRSRRKPPTFNQTALQADSYNRIVARINQRPVPTIPHCPVYLFRLNLGAHLKTIFEPCGSNTRN